MERGVSAVPPATELRAGLCEPVHGGHGARPPGPSSWVRARFAGARFPPGPRRGVPTRLPTAARAVNTRRPPPPCPGRRGRNARADPHFCASCHAPGKRRRGRRGGKRRQRYTEGRRRARVCAAGRAARAPRRLPPAPRARLPAGVAPKTRTTGTFLTGAWVRGDWQISSPCSGLAM